MNPNTTLCVKFSNLLFWQSVDIVEHIRDIINIFISYYFINIEDIMENIEDIVENIDNIVKNIEDILEHIDDIVKNLRNIVKNLRILWRILWRILKILWKILKMLWRILWILWRVLKILWGILRILQFTDLIHIFDWHPQIRFFLAGPILRMAQHLELRKNWGDRVK